ncbi:MAG: CBS domain-containing protein, partial [Candidatus Methanomethyliaceae archaeon]|nr:CBS domain-containing protein [Candidatus Methanomethyliaceae archaeon]MDW7970957.1 CBS domain-containing protein [Nitrososphaerota archaeon]
SPISAISETSSIITAAKKMVLENIRGLPVVNNNGELVGIITKTDLTRYFADNFRGKMPVKLIYQKENLPIVRRTHSIYRVMTMLEDLNVDRVIVVEGNKPVGIITETDLSFLAPPKKVESFFKIRRREFSEMSYDRIYLIPIAEDIMTRDPIVVEEEKDASEAAKIIIDNNIGGMPVVDGKGELSGIITKFDFVRAIAREVEKLD